MNNANSLSSYSSVMNEKYIGILISLIIHIGFILILLAVPSAKLKPHLQIIQVSFYNQSEFPIDSQKLSAAKSKETNKIVSKDNFKAIAVQPAHKEAPQKSNVLMNNPIIIAMKTVPDEKPVATQSQNTVVIPAKSAGNQGISQETLLTTSKGNIQQGIVESRFGDNGSPAFIHQEIPVYPILARRLGKEGKVLLKLLIDTNGKLQKIEVVEPAGFGFTEAAVEAVKKSTYAPGYRNGEKVSTKALLPVRFQLQ
jgi:protein TonB